MYFWKYLVCTDCSQYRINATWQQVYQLLQGKGQIKSKADWRALDSPKKQTNKFVLFAFLLFTANKTNSSIYLWKNLRRAQTTFNFIWPLVKLQLKSLHHEKLYFWYLIYLQCNLFLPWPLLTSLIHDFLRQVPICCLENMRIKKSQKSDNNIYCTNAKKHSIISFISFHFGIYTTLEIKPCGLGSRITDMEADLIYWRTFRLLFISFGKQNWHCGMDWTLS